DLLKTSVSRVPMGVASGARPRGCPYLTLTTRVVKSRPMALIAEPHRGTFMGAPFLMRGSMVFPLAVAMATVPAAQDLARGEAEFLRGNVHCDAREFAEAVACYERDSAARSPRSRPTRPSSARTPRTRSHGRSGASSWRN